MRTSKSSWQAAQVSHIVSESSRNRAELQTRDSFVPRLLDYIYCCLLFSFSYAQLPRLELFPSENKIGPPRTSPIDWRRIDCGQRGQMTPESCRVNQGQYYADW